MSNKLQKNHNKGFTLAEVLVTLAIIGIIASLTIPAMIQISNKNKYEAGLKKAMSTLSQAYRYIVSDYGSIENQFSSSDELKNLFGNYINYVKSCTFSGVGGTPKTYEECFPESGKNLYGNAILYSSVGAHGALGVDGISYLFRSESTDCSSTTVQVDGVGVYCALIRVDVNGLKGPNIFGRDVHQLRLTKIGIIPSGSDIDNDSDWSVKCNPASADDIENGEGCAARVIQNGMDY